MPTRKSRKASKVHPINVIEGLPPKGAKIARGRAIAQAPKSGCGPCEWMNTGATLVGGMISAVRQAGYRTCWVYVPVLGPHGRVDYYKVSWSERCNGTRVVSLGK